MNLAIVRQQISNLLIELPELADDDVLRNDMVEAETNAHEFLALLERRRQEAEHMTEAIAANITALSERKARMVRREDAMRKLMLKVMEAADLRKVELAEATIGIRNGSEKVVINDEASVPKELCNVKYTPDKVRIRLLIEAGTAFNWASVVRGEPSISIRVK